MLPSPTPALSSPVGHAASVAGSPAQPRPELREPCLRLHIPVVGSGCEISWASELKKTEAGVGAVAGAGARAGAGANSGEPVTNGAGPSDAVAQGQPPAALEPAKSRRELDFAKPQNRFHQMVQEMERKYATARPLLPPKRPAGQEGGRGRGKSKVARSSAADAGSSAVAGTTAGAAASTGDGGDDATTNGLGGTTAAVPGGGSAAVRSEAEASVGAGGDRMLTVPSWHTAWPPGTRGVGPGLLYAPRRSASAAQDLSANTWCCL